MSNFREVNRKEPFLLPPSVDEFVPDGHLARMIDEVVERLDTEPIERKYSRLGRKAYHPKMLIKLLFYGYSTGERSSRRLAKKCETDLAYLYLAGMEKPDFRTISDFRKNHLPELKDYFRQIILICQGLGLGKGPALFIDSSKIKANASAKKTKSKAKLDELLGELDKSIAEVFREAEDIDEQEDAEFGDRQGDELPPDLRDPAQRRKRLEEVKKRLEEEGWKKINLTDQDAKFMQERQGVIRPAYNCQVAVSEDGLIVAQDSVDRAFDHYELKPMVEMAFRNVGGGFKQIAADGSYGTYEALEYLKEKHLDGYIPDTGGEIRKLLKASRPENRYHYLNWHYEPEGDFYLCPEGKRLRLSKQRRLPGSLQKSYIGKDCLDCKVLTECTKIQFRRITVDSRLGLVRAMLEKFRSEAGWAFYQRRMGTVEPVFGNLKFNLGFRQFHLRSLEKVKGEFSLMCIGHNLGKLYQRWKEEKERIKKGVLTILGVGFRYAKA